jgi:FtsP/CotA-like multicopper oxidase with cupredoxin domain
VLAPSLGVFSPSNAQTPPATGSKADYTLRIAHGNIELSPGHMVATTLYNGQFPGPMLRLTEGKRVIVDVYNDTDLPEVAHWHGQMIPSEVDGAIEEGTPVIPPHGMRRIGFVPKPSGFRFLHTHVTASSDLNRGTYSGQVAPVSVSINHCTFFG